MAEARDLTLAEMVESNRRMREALKDARFFIQDILDNGHPDRASIGNLMGARDVIDAALSYPEQSNG